MKILVLNSPSSSQKLCHFWLGEVQPDNPPACLWEAKTEWNDGVATIASKSMAARI